MIDVKDTIPLAKQDDLVIFMNRMMAERKVIISQELYDNMMQPEPYDWCTSPQVKGVVFWSDCYPFSGLDMDIDQILELAEFIEKTSPKSHGYVTHDRETYSHGNTVEPLMIEQASVQ